MLCGHWYLVGIEGFWYLNDVNTGEIYKAMEECIPSCIPSTESRTKWQPKCYLELPVILLQGLYMADSDPQCAHALLWINVFDNVFANQIAHISSAVSTFSEVKSHDLLPNATSCRRHKYKHTTYWFVCTWDANNKFSQTWILTMKLKLSIKISLVTKSIGNDWIFILHTVKVKIISSSWHRIKPLSF